MVLEARLHPITRWEVNAHFMPQCDACALHTIGYHNLIPLEDNSYGMVQIAMALGLTSTTTAAAASAGGSSSSSNGGGVAKLQKRHVVSKKDKPELSSEAMGLLARVYIQDINLLQFPVSWGNWSGGNRSEAARRMTLQVSPHLYGMFPR